MKKGLAKLKPTYRIGYIALLILFAIASCSKTTTPTNTSTGSVYSMNASIGGTPFSRDSCLFSLQTDTGNAEIVGWAGLPTTRSDYYPQITLFISPSYHGIGTYNLNDSGNDAEILFSNTTPMGFSQNGVITITAASPNIVGTFSFTTTSGTVVTNGTFTALRQ